MRSRILILLLTFGASDSQFFGSSLFSIPWGQGAIPSRYGKPIHPSPFGYGSPIGNFGRPSGSNSPIRYDDDPVPPPDSGSQESSYDPQNLPARLPIRAPNGVLEIYNRMVDDLIRNMKVEFERRELDPMGVVIRPTPPGPVRVPGHLQKRPYRRPGAALYRSNSDKPTLNGKFHRSSSREESPSEVIPRSRRVYDYPEDFDYAEGSDEFIPLSQSRKEKIETKKKKNPEKSEIDEDEEAAEAKRDTEKLLLRYRQKLEQENRKNPDRNSESNERNNKRPDLNEDPEDPVPQQEDPDDEDYDDDYDDSPEWVEPGTRPSGGNRPLGGYYPQDGSVVVPPKPNAELRGLSNIQRSSDVSVGIDARSATITSRLVVGPITVHINDSSEPMEEGVRAIIPELEAEMILMERHGVIFLQRFTLDRAYGQDVEISIPKRKSGGKRKKGGNRGGIDSNHNSMHLAAQQRFQTKMAAHISMEMVKLLRSGNLRLKIMRTARTSMTKVKLPITKAKKRRKSNKKNKKRNKKRRN